MLNNNRFFVELFNNGLSSLVKVTFGVDEVLVVDVALVVDMSLVVDVSLGVDMSLVKNGTLVVDVTLGGGSIDDLSE